jgi:hypothetical protein
MMVSVGKLVPSLNSIGEKLITSLNSIGEGMMVSVGKLVTSLNSIGEGMMESVGKLVSCMDSVGGLDGPGDGCGKGMKVLNGILDGDLDEKTLLDGKPEGPLDEDVDLDSPGDGCKEGMIEVVGEAVTRGESSTTVSKIATTLGRSRRKMVSL